MANDDFKRLLSFGQQGQNVIINILERHFGYEFLAGERDGKIYNTDFIEEIEHCNFVTGAFGKGPQLQFFTDKDELVFLDCPDIFMRDDREVFCWIEAKRRETHYPFVYINKESFDDYQMFYEEFSRTETFLIMALVPEDNTLAYHDLYSASVADMIASKGSPKRKGKSVFYEWDLRTGVMRKLNRYPIDINRYL